MVDIQLPIVYLIVVWLANINDLIRGHWFYHDWQQVVFWNVIGAVSLMAIISKIKKNDKKKS